MDTFLHQPNPVLLSDHADGKWPGSLCVCHTRCTRTVMANFESIRLYTRVFQFYFVHTFSFMEPAMLLALTCDHFVTISNPVRYPSFLTGSRVLKLRVFGGILSTSLIFPGMCLLVFSYCQQQYPFSFLLSTREYDLTLLLWPGFNSFYALSVILLAMGSHSLFIVWSHILILRSVVAIVSHVLQLKAPNTGVSHILAVLVFRFLC